MKKLVALVLFACFLMAFTAFGEETIGRPVLQNEQPPKVVTFEDENGQTMIAKFCDPEGNVLSYIADDGTIVFTDVHNRTEITDEVVIERITNAYEWVMHDVHYSDVASVAEEIILKTDINEVLLSMGLDLNAHDLVMFELFDTMFYGDELPEGHYIEFTLAMDEELTLPLLIAYTEGGEHWEVFHNYTVGEGNEITIRLDKPGVLALLLDHETAFSLGDSYEQDIVIDSSEDAEVEEINNFTPSVSGKPAPAIVSYSDDAGNIYVGKILNRNNTQVIDVPNNSYIVITPVSERDFVADIQTHEHLEWAYDDINGVESVGDLSTEDENVTIGEMINLMLNNVVEGMTHEDMIVRDLFEITAYGEYVDFFYEEGAFIEITFDTELDPTEPFIVLCSHNSVNWHSLPAEDVIVNADGTVTLRIEELGTIAFLVDAEGVLDNIDLEDAVVSPN